MSVRDGDEGSKFVVPAMQFEKSLNLWTRRVQEGPERSNISNSFFFSSCSFIPRTNFETSLGDDQFLWLRDMTS